MWFSWTVPIEEGDGGVLDYKFTVTGVDIVGKKYNETGSTSARSVFVKGLKPFTEFKVTVMSRNKHGFSNGTSVNFTTEEGGKK